jgi:Family of unknown function (DUF5681)
MPKDYEVGYRKPPSESRFTKGQSGNPSGRPRGSKNVATMFYKIVRERITVKENGRARKMTRLEAVLYQLTNRALSGDQRAMKEFVYLSRVFQEPEQPEEEVPVLHERESAVLENVLKRMQRMTQTTDTTTESK